MEELIWSGWVWIWAGKGQKEKKDGHAEPWLKTEKTAGFRKN
jgi:hypothetical protein